LKKLAQPLAASTDKERPDAVVRFERNAEELITVVKLGREEEQEKPVRAQKPWPAASIQVLTRDIAKALGIEGQKGVRVSRVLPDRAAEKAGLRVGDIVTKIDGVAIDASTSNDEHLFAGMLRRYRVGQDVTLDVLRDKEPLQLTMQLEAPPARSDRMPHLVDDEFEFTAREMALGDRLDRGESELPGNVVISKVEQGGWAALGGLQTQDVILEVDGKDITDISRLKEVLAGVKARTPRRVAFFIRRNIYTTYAEVEMDWNGASTK
jgi:S1-C subfamily serine protease